MSATGIVILGVNGNCLDIAEAVEAMAATGKRVYVKGFLDDSTILHGTQIGDYTVLGALDDAKQFSDCLFVNGIGSPKSYGLKPVIVERVGIVSARWATIIHPTACISRHAKIGHGSVLLSNVSVGSSASVGNHCMVLQNCVISHHAIINDFSAVASGVCISGGCEVGVNCYLGSNACLRDGIVIGERTLIGIGSVVTKSLPARTVAYGNPARISHEA